MRDNVLYTPEEIAQILKLSKYTIYEMIKRGEIPAHRIGRSLRVSESQLDTYLQQVRYDENTFEGETVDVAGSKFGKVIGNTGDVYFNITTDLEGSIKMTIKPEDIILAKQPVVSSARNVHEGVITSIEEVENGYKITVNIGVFITSHITKTSLHELDLKLGDQIYCIFKSLAIVVV